jgi:RNA polymerase sigma factor (TIGR02999 family)
MVSPSDVTALLGDWSRGNRTALNQLLVYADLRRVSAAEVMRRIPVDHARRHGASKRGEGVRCVSIDEAKDVHASNEMPILALDHALDRLETVDAELAKIVGLRAFGGLTIEEAAHVLSVSPSTAKRDWRTAKAWLNRELGSEVRP